MSRYENKGGTFLRAITKLLKTAPKPKPYCTVERGRLLVGTQSTHRTPNGVAYNKLIRLKRKFI